MSVTGSILAATGLAGAGISAFGANQAANTQANAANNAAGVERQNAIDALNFQKQVYGDQQRNIQPWLQTGSASMYDLARLMGLNVPQSTMSAQPNWGSSTGNMGGLTQFLGGSGGSGAIGPRMQAPAPGFGAPAGAGSSIASPDFGGGVNTMSANGAQVGKLAPGASTPVASPILNRILPGEGGNPGGPAGTSGNGIMGGVPSGGGLAVNMSPGGPGVANLSSPGGAVSMSSGGGGSQVPMGNGSGPDGAGGAFGSLATPFGESFQAPTGVTEQNDPGYQFRLKTGLDAYQNSAAARGALSSGGTAKGLQDYAQNSASNEYSNVYNRALGEFQQRYNIYNQDQSTLFNRLMALAGGGQTAAAQLNSAGSNAAGNVGNILLGSGGQIGNNINNAGAARASGYVGGTNAASGALNNIGNLAMLNQILSHNNSNNFFNGGNPLPF